MSPIRYVKNIKSKFYLLIGKKDLRVPAVDGLAFVNALR